MRKFLVILLMALSFLLANFKLNPAYAKLNWRELSKGILNARCVLIDSENPKIIYLGAEGGLFKTIDAGKNWKSALLTTGKSKKVNYIVFAPGNKNALYAATGNGLFFSANQGETWKRIFKGKNALENECITLAVLSDRIFVGTRSGLFVSQDKGCSWHKQTAKLGNSHILSITYNPDAPSYLYVACVNGVFKSENAGKSWERVFVAPTVENGKEEEEEIEGQDEEERFSHIRYISIDKNNSNYIYLATSRGIYKSEDSGKTWNPFSDYGLLNKETKFLLISEQPNLYAVTKSGVFEYRDKRWEELSFNLAAEEINYLALDKQDNLYVASGQGLFKAELKSSALEGNENIISIYSKAEPKINEIQQAAIKYAEVEPDKIKEWRKKAKMKAILPKLTVGLDNSKNTNYEIYTSATTHYVYEGPDDNSSGWDVTLSWDLGDLIWNNDQTSIDVRSRLLVELRNDILDEVTKLYFARLQIKMEIDNLSIEEQKKRLEKELRLEELTASLDALTGGYFSRQIKRKF